MKKITLIAIILLSLSTGLFSASIRIVGVYRRVSVRRYPGAPWVAARRGMIIRRGGSISTGFRSVAILRVYPTGSVVRLNQFTYTTVNRLRSFRGYVYSNFKLRVGSVRAVVKSKKRFRSRFSISTPVATASVRGTIPLVSHFPKIGTTVVYLKGFGTVLTKRGRMLLLAAKQLSRSTKGGTMTPGEVSRLIRTVGAFKLNLTSEELWRVIENKGNSFFKDGNKAAGIFRRFIRGRRIPLLREPQLM